MSFNRSIRLISQGGRRRAALSALVGLAAVIAACGNSTRSSTPTTTAPAAATTTTNVVSAASSYAPWPMALHDARHTGTASALGPQTGHLLWSSNLGSSVAIGPIVGSDGTIYAASADGVLFALDRATGKIRWQLAGSGPFTGSQDLSTSALLLPSGDLLWPAPGGVLAEVSSRGVLIWSQTMGGTVLSPVLVGTTAYVVTSNGDVSAVALGGSRPMVIWTVHTGAASFGSPAIDGAGHVVTTAGKSLIAVQDHGASGSIVWSRKLHSDVEVSPSVDGGGNIYVTDNTGSASSYTSSGDLRWSKAVGVESYSSSSVAPNGQLVVGDNAGQISLAAPATGATVASYSVSHLGLWAAQAIDARGDIYVGTQSGTIVGITPQGRVLFRIRAAGPFDHYPALTGDGVLIIGDRTGNLYAVGPAPQV